MQFYRSFNRSSVIAGHVSWNYIALHCPEFALPHDDVIQSGRRLAVARIQSVTSSIASSTIVAWLHYIQSLTFCWLQVPLTIVYRQPPMYVHNQKLGNMHHRGDIAKLEVLIEYGGIYLDYDVVVVNSLNPLRQYDATLGNFVLMCHFFFWNFDRKLKSLRVDRCTWTKTSTEIDERGDWLAELIECTLICIMCTRNCWLIHND